MPTLNINSKRVVHIRNKKEGKENGKTSSTRKN